MIKVHKKCTENVEMLMNRIQIKTFYLTHVHCWRTIDVDCILSGVQKSILFRGKILVMWKSILFRKKIFSSSSSKKHFVSQAKKYIWYWCSGQKKMSWKKLIVNLFLIFNRCLIINSSLIFKHSEILIQFHKLT